jgi:hypothetical protein
MSNIQAGTILMKDLPLITQLLRVESEPCSGNWRRVKELDGFALDRKIHALGWNFFFMAAEIKVMFFGALGAKNIQNALQRIIGRVNAQDFNCLEVTGIIATRFLGVTYATVSAHSRHIQQSCQLDNIEQRQANQQEPSDSLAGRESPLFPLQKADQSAIAPE